jgi:hypothetical protein
MMSTLVTWVYFTIFDVVKYDRMQLKRAGGVMQRMRP